MDDYGPYRWYIFERLGIPITENFEKFTTAHRAIASRINHEASHGTGITRERALLYQKAHGKLRDEEKLKQLVRACFEKTTPAIDAALAMHDGSMVDAKLLEFLANVPNGTFEFDDGVVKPLLLEYLRAREPPIEIGKPVDMGWSEGPEARLVSNVTFTPHVDGALLAWTLPESDCERVVIARGVGVAPNSPADAIDVGRAESWLDKNAQNGKTYVYVIYSVLKGNASTRGAEVSGYRSPPQPEFDKPRVFKGGVRLSWTSPPGCRRVRVFRSERREGRFHVSEGLLVPPGWKELENLGDESHDDRTVAPATHYYYRLFGEYGDGRLTAASETSIETPRGGPEPRLVEGLKFAPRRDGALLTWRLPVSDCEMVAVVRSDGRPPERIDDGDEIHRGRTESFLDQHVPDRWSTFYGVFSLQDGRISTECSHVIGYQPQASAEVKPPALQKTTDGQLAVRLTWTPPKGGKRLWIYRSEHADEVFYVAGDRPETPDGCVHLQTTEKGLYDDTTPPPGKLLNYHLVADYGDGRFSPAESVSFEMPKPLKFSGLSVKQEHRHATVKWEPLPAGCQYIVYRMPVGELPDIRRSKHVYRGEECGYTDDRIRPGESYEYFLYARLGEVAAGPVSAGQITVLKEVDDVVVTAADRSVQLTWTSPENAVRVLVERVELADESARIDWSRGRPCPGATTQGLNDAGLSESRWYAYRIACVFRDPTGKEHRTAGFTTSPCRPYRHPPAPTGIETNCDGKQVRIKWDFGDPAPIVLRSQGPILKTPPLLPSDRAERASVPSKDGVAVEDLRPNAPWYLIASPLDDRVLVHRQFFVAPLELEMQRTFGAIQVTWRWPSGVSQVRVDHSIVPHGRGPLSPQSGTMVETKHGDDAHGRFGLDLPDTSGRYQLEIQVSPLASGAGIVVLKSATGVVTRNIDMNPAQISWRVERHETRRLMRKPKLGAPVLHLDINKRLRFDGIKLVGWPYEQDEDDAEVLLEWPLDSASAPNGEHRIEFAHPQPGTVWRCKLALVNREDETQVLIIPPDDGFDLIE